jgi:hypothetical protein
MNDITLCLITRGRHEFLDQLLDSFNQIIQYPCVKFMIILNGASQDINEKFNTWSKTYADKIELHYFPHNDARLTSFFPLINSVETDWICFPSDDDIIDEAFFEQWEDLVSSFSSFGAIATNLELIDAQGKSLGIIKKPSYDIKLPLEESAAKSLSECPFLWPGLIIRVKELPMSIPGTRYVSDWWVGLHLLFKSNVQVIDRVFTKYRVHPDQESNVSSLSRKNLEALVHLGSFVRSKSFSDWILELETVQVKSFLENLVKYPPIYGDSKFSKEFVSLVTDTVKTLRVENDVRSIAHMVNAYSHGVIISESQILYLGDFDTNAPTSNRFNLNFIFDEQCCSKIKDIQSKIEKSSSVYSSVSVACSHINNSKHHLLLDCESLDLTSNTSDLLAQLGNEFLHKSGVFEGSVSQFEYSLIQKVRRLKNRIPASFNKIIYRSKSV